MTVDFTTWRGVTDGQEYAIPDSVVDNFEDADADSPGVYEEGETLADYYTLETSTDDVFRTTNDVAEGDHAVAYDAEETNDSAAISVPGDGLNRYPEPGDTIGLLIRSEDVDDPFPGFLFNVKGPWSDLEAYQATWRPQDDRAELYRRGDGGSVESTIVDDENVTMPDNTWMWAEIDTPSLSDDTIEFRWYDLDVNGDDLSRGSLIDSISGNDDTYVSEDHRGVGFLDRAIGGPVTFIDWIRVLE